jgi:hypothetical protein
MTFYQEDAECMRQTAYEEIWRAEDEIRHLYAELAQRNSKVTNLHDCFLSKSLPLRACSRNIMFPVMRYDE